MDKQLDLLELLREFPEATLTVHAGDLGHFARELLAEARQDFERERVDCNLDFPQIVIEKGTSLVG